MTLGIVLHSANVFTDTQWAIQNNQTSEFFSYLVDLIHAFRMPAFFIVSGFFCHMTLSRYGSKLFLSTRIPRILIPLLVVAISLNTLQNWILSDYHETDFTIFTIEYWLQGKWISHLWFLNCLIYYFFTAALLHTFIPKTLTYSSDLLSRLMLSSNGLYLFIAPVVTLIFLKVSYQIPEFPFNAYNLCIAESIKYAPFFIFGSLLGYNRNLMHDFIKTKAIFTIITALFFIAYIFIPTDKTSTHYIFDLYIHSLIPWILCVLCFKFFNRFFNKESGFFSYLSEASYTIYLFHQFFVIAYGIVLINTELNIILKFIILISTTFISTHIIHKYFILKFDTARYMFNGKKNTNV